MSTCPRTPSTMRTMSGAFPRGGMKSSTRRSRSAGSTPSRSSRRDPRAQRSGGRRSGRSPRSVTSPVLDLEGEAPEATENGVVEGSLVLVGHVLLERRGEVVAEVGENLRAGLDEVDVVTVALLGLVT